MATSHTHLLSLIGSLFLPVFLCPLSAGIKHKSDKIRREWLLLLHHLIVTFPTLYPGFQHLLHDNPDLDFLLNITHIQSHRRAKALSRLSTTLPLLSARVLMDVILPLVNEALLSSAGEGGGVESRFSTPHSRAQRGTEGADVGLMEAAIGLLRLMGGLLPFSAYYAQLLSYVRLMRERKREAMEKLMVRAICALVEGWKYDVIEGQQMSEQERKDEQHAVQRNRRPQRRQTKGRPVRGGKGVDKPGKGQVAAPEKKEEAVSDGAMVDDTVEVEEEVEQSEQVEELHDETKEGETEEDKLALDDQVEDEEEAEAADDDIDDTDDIPVDETSTVIAVRSAAESAAQRARTLAVKVRHTLSAVLLPQLNSLLTGTKRGDSLSLLRPALALAIVHLLGRLPSDFFDLHFPRLLTSLLSQLQRREQEARDITRRVMVDMVPVIGVQRLSMVLDEARATLRRGNQPHVFGYYVHCVLERLVRERVDVGLLDDGVECVMAVVMDEMVGEVGREKEVDALKRQAKEVRQNKSMEVVEALSELCSFTRIPTILNALRQVLSTTVRSEEVKKVKEALRRVGEGLMRNRGLDIRQLLVFVYGMVKEVTEAAGGAATKPKTEEKQPPDPMAAMDDDDDEDDDELLTAQEKAARMRPGKEVTLGVQKPTIATSRAALSSTHNAPILLHFALSLLNNALAHHKLHETDPGIPQMLDPYLNLLATACLLMKSTTATTQPTKARGGAGSGGMGAVSNEVIEMALRICNHLLRFSTLPSLPSFVPPFNSFLFTLLTSGQAQLTSAAFKTLSILIYHSKCTFTPQQLSLLFSFINQDLTTITDTSFVFPLLHSILSRQLLHTELYDTMARVAELCVVSGSGVVRQRCGELFVLFLLDYPIGVKRMRQHLTFLLSQLSYSVKSGRLSVLGVLGEVVRRFPVVVLDEWVELMVLPLLLVMVNEEEAEVREAAGNVLRAVIGRVSGEKQRMIGRWLDKWMDKGGGAGAEETPVERVRRCGAMQCYGLMVDVVGGATDDKQLAAVMKHVTAVVRQEDRRLAQKDGRDVTTEGMKPEEKDEEVVFGHEDEDEQEDEQKQPMEDVQTGGGDNEAEESENNVQSQSGDWRLLYLTLMTVEKALKQPPPLRDNLAPYLSPSSPSSILRSLIYFLLHPHSWIRSVSARLVAALVASSYELPPDVTFRLLKSSCMQLNTQPLRQKLATDVSHNLFALTQHALSLDWSAELPQPEADGDDEQKDMKPSLARIHNLLDNPHKVRALNWTFHRLSYLARQPGDTRRLAILALFRSTITGLPYSSWSPYLLSLMHALFRLSNQEVEGAVKDEAVLLMEELQRRVDGAVFLAVYNEVRGGVLGVRRDRREKRKVMALTDPAQFVRRKQDHHGRKRESRKQRMEHSKLAKYVRGATAADVRQRMEQNGGTATGERMKKRMRQH